MLARVSREYPKQPLLYSQTNITSTWHHHGHPALKLNLRIQVIQTYTIAFSVHLRFLAPKFKISFLLTLYRFWLSKMINENPLDKDIFNLQKYVLLMKTSVALKLLLLNSMAENEKYGNTD